ncbi:MAG: DUF421 domain-containing protein [Thermovenabulum sp.]|uniref:DUF421 domain-containing protein n=1 Tax=Thermovenabulum sp. TaxID=3100335 RepID=UPI003C7E3216
MLKTFLILSLRSTVLFFVSLLIVRFMGKRTIAQLSPFDLIVIIIMGSAIAIPLEDKKIHLNYGIVPVVVMSLLNYLISIVISKNRVFENILQGTSTVLVRDGEVIIRNLKKERITMADLMILLREQNISNINDVEEATIEPNGKLSIILKKDKQPVTPKDLGLSATEGIFRTVVVSNGEVVKNSLDMANVGIEQLFSELKKRGINRLDELEKVWIDENGKITFELSSERR